jgi:hypothetical protein
MGRVYNTERGGIASIELRMYKASGECKLTENLPNRPLSHSSRLRAHPSSARPRARNRTQASRAARSPRCAYHRATHRAPRDYARLAGDAASAPRDPPRSARTGRASVAHVAAATCARAVWGSAAQGSTQQSSAGRSRSRVQGPPRQVGSVRVRLRRAQKRLLRSLSRWLSLLKERKSRCWCCYHAS